MVRLAGAWLGLGMVTGAAAGLTSGVAAQTPGGQPAAPIVRQEAPKASSVQAESSTAGPQRPYTISVAAREVVLDVVAVDAKGRSVTGLKAGDFTLLEDGVPQTLLSVSEHHAMTAAEVAGLASPGKLPANLFTSFAPVGNTNAVTVILIDALDTPVTAQMYVRQQMIGFFKTMQPGSMFAVFQLDSRLRLVQGFTSDPGLLMRAMESKREMPALRGNLTLAERRQMLNEALQAMGSYLAAFPGRKNVVWFTGAVPKLVLGLKRNPFPDGIDYDMRVGYGANAQSLSRVAIYPIDGRGIEVYSSFNTSHEAMDRVADRTGGRAYHNTNGLKEALREIAETSSNYYTVAYAPTNPAWNAHRRKIELSANGRRVMLLYRHGYYARKERKPQRVADAKRAAEIARAYVPGTESPVAEAAPDEGKTEDAEIPMRPALTEAMELGTVPAGELLFDVSITAATSVTKLGKGEPVGPNNFLREDLQGKPFRNYRLLYTVDPSKVSFTLSSDGHHHGQLEYVAMVYAADGEAVNSLISSSEVEMDEKTYKAALSGKKTLGTTQEIAVPEKGNYFLRIGVHDVTGDLVGTTEVPVDQVQKGVAGPGQVLAP